MAGAEQYDENNQPPAEFLEALNGYDEERHVRDAAQAIIVKHLAVEVEGAADWLEFWPDLDLDLSGARLRGFSLDGCSIRKADFSDTHFEGGIFIARTEFRGTPWGTNGPVGVGGATFTHCKVRGHAVFEDVDFHSDASFEGADFTRTFYLGGAKFAGKCDFSTVTFRGRAEFEGSKFGTGADFSEATFKEGAIFSSGVIYDSGAHFEGHEADFTDATFSGSVDFSGATFQGVPISADTAPNGTNFTGAQARSGSDLSRKWPSGWCDGAEVEPEYIAVIRDASNDSPGIGNP